tara:strand:+ start:142 stop:672 length:531 start_codon:yes stop_codon:yes gene_type:complete
MSVICYEFKNGNTIEAYPKSPDFGRMIVAQVSNDLNTHPVTKETFFKTTTRVAFIKGKMVDLVSNFGHLKNGQLFDGDLCIAKRESFAPFWTYQKTMEDGTKQTISQPSKIKPANKAKGTPEEVVTVDGKPVYMQFYIATLGTKDTPIVAGAVVEEEQDAEDLIQKEIGADDLSQA